MVGSGRYQHSAGCVADVVTLRLASLFDGLLGGPVAVLVDNAISADRRPEMPRILKWFKFVLCRLC